MDIAAFRAAFLEFADTTKYPDAAINGWESVAPTYMSQDVFGDSYGWGLQLFVAHWLSVGARNVRVAAKGGIPGETRGIVSSKSLDRASEGFDTTSVTIKDAGFWNSSSYGVAWYQLVLAFGAGGLQL